MTIKELIAELEGYPPERMVVVRGYEGGYGNPHPRAVSLVPDGNREQIDKGAWYYGPHSEAYDDENYHNAVKAVCI